MRAVIKCKLAHFDWILNFDCNLIANQISYVCMAEKRSNNEKQIGLCIKWNRMVMIRDIFLPTERFSLFQHYIW